MATQAEITANWVAYQEAMGLGGRTPTQEERQTAIKDYFETNPDATPDAIAKAATDFGVSAEEIAQATGYEDVSKIQSGIGSYQSTGSTGQTVADYTGGGSTDTASKVQQDLSSGKISESEAQNRLNKIVGIESIPDVDSTTVYSQSDAPLTQSNINDIYRSVLGRDVGTEGLEYFLGSDTQVKSEADLVRALQDSPEYGSVTAVRDWFEENPSASIQDIAGAMDEFGVGAKVVEQATGRPAEEVTALYKTVTGGLPAQAVFGAATSEDPDIRREVIENQYRDLFGRDPGPEADYWITGGGKNTPLTSTAILNAAQDADINAYNDRVAAGEVTPKYYNDPQLNLMANAYAQGDIDEVNELIQQGKYTFEDIQAAFGITDAGMQELRASGVKEFKLVAKYYVLPDGTVGVTYGDLPSGASSISVNEYNRLKALQGVPRFYQMPDGTVGIVYGTAELPSGATEISEEAYNKLIQKGQTGVIPGGSSGAVSGNIVAGAPQVGEVNIMDYMGLQAAAPVFPQDTQLAAQIGQIEATDETLQALAPEDVLSTDGTYVATPSEITASTVTAPTPQEAVTATASTTDLVDQPEAAKMTAEKSLDQINKEADALQAARQDLNEIDPKATVQGQLALLQEQFADGEIPVWASGAFRQVNALMAQRGLGGSTIAAEAITNALMQSALPIAQQDASFYQNVTIQNLSNEQQAEMAKFNARTSAIFNDQAAENAARSLNTQSENELSRFFAELAQNVALSNTAQVNSMEQFNATAQNQMTQFFEELGLTADTFNADSLNELATFNAEQANIIAQFNASLDNQREQFNVQNQLAIDASNVQWRRDVNTANTSATNAALQFDAQNLLGIQQTALNNIWQHYDTILNYAYQSEQNEIDRAYQLMLTTMSQEFQRSVQEDSDLMSLVGDGVKSAAMIASSKSGRNFIDSINPFSSNDDG